MSGRYPDFQGWQHDPKATEPCECCDRQSIGTVRIAFSYMRGDDAFYHVCHRHMEMARNQTRRMVAHAATKARWFASKQAEAAS